MPDHIDIDDYLKKHYIHRSNWLRAAVLGANDGILSTASIAVGVAAASSSREPLLLATLAGLVAGALSMAAGEFVSVSSQTDIETADIEREKKELKDDPEDELQVLTKIYMDRGLQKDTAKEVARQLTEHDALGAHVRDELGITELHQANPLQAALASGASFVAGGIFPFLAALFLPLNKMILYQYGMTILFLMMLGAVSAKAGGAPIGKAVVRITFWGTIAMGLTALVGHYFGSGLV